MAKLKSGGSAPERGPMVILFAETRGFTGTSAMLEPSIVMARVSEFFDLVAAAVEAHQGVVVNVLNDTVTATFAGKEDAQRAVRAAEEILSKFDPFAQAWERDYGVHTAVAVGMHRGDAIAGPAGGPGKQDFVFGDCVSIAERLLHRARAGEFVLSEAMIKVLKESGLPLKAVELPPLELSRRAPIRIFGMVLDTRLDFT
jgi:adenylate cyclase